MGLQLRIPDYRLADRSMLIEYHVDSGRKIKNFGPTTLTGRSQGPFPDVPALLSSWYDMA
jgi:hypothetical protein